MGKNILAILGSPHKHGHCATLMEKHLEEAKKYGYSVDYVYLYEEHIAYCTGCRRCDQSNVCVLQDDATKLADLMKNCDIVILAAPVYWANVPAIVKNIFDRLVGVVMKKTKTFPQPKLSKDQRYILVTSCDTTFPFSWLFGQSRGCIHAMKEFFKTSGMTYGGKFIWENPKDDEIPPRRMKKIEQFWKSFAKENK